MTICSCETMVMIQYTLTKDSTGMDRMSFILWIVKINYSQWDDTLKEKGNCFLYKLRIYNFLFKFSVVGIQWDSKNSLNKTDFLTLC